jgi:uncharacterized membrane protein
MHLETRKIVIAGLLGAVSIILGVTQLGFIPVPTPAGSATIMHIPAIVAGILEGPMVGLFVGFIFGLSSFIRGAAFFTDPVVAILPRLLIGVIAYYAYLPFKKNIYVGSAVAAIVGTLANSIGVLSLAVLRGYIPSWFVAGGDYLNPRYS